MKILAFSDLRTIQELPNEDADLVVLLGGIPSKIVNHIDNHYNCLKVGLLSNKCHPTLYDNTSITNIHGKVVEVEGINIAGFGGVPLYDEDELYGQFKESDVEYFIKQLRKSDVDVLLSYTNIAYGQVNAPLARSGFKAYSQIIMEEIVDHLIHGRIQHPATKVFGNVKVHSVYPYAIIEV